MKLIILVIIILILVVILLIMGSMIAGIITGGMRQTLDESLNWQYEHVPGAREFKKTDFKDYIVKSYDGYELHASILPAEKDSGKWIIMAHGYTDTRYGMLKYIQFFHKLGFSCVCYDERGHGENKAFPCSYGIREAKDLMEVIDDLYEKKGERIRLGLLGESLGGATVITALKYRPKVEFVVDDCGFAEILPILKVGIKRTKLPSFLVYPASFMAKIRFGESFTAARPVVSLEENRIPLLIMHGADDDFIPPEHSKKIQNATKGYSELHLTPEAGHAASAIRDPENYLKVVDAFLKRLEEKKG